MHTFDLVRLGRKYIPNFVGVYPLDKMPQLMHTPANFIVNTHTHDLPGEHWIAVSYRTGGIVFAFDPFGAFYPKRLQNYLVNVLLSKSITYNKLQYQGIFERNCGHYCVAWLIYINKCQNHLIRKACLM